MEFARYQRLKQELSVAPLIDVVFLLLIFFMLTSTFIEPEAVDLLLEGGQSGTVTPAEPLEVQVTTEGTIRLNGLRLSLGQLTTEISARIKGDQERAVSIKEDAEVQVQVLVQIMDQVQLAGANNLRLAIPEAN